MRNRLFAIAEAREVKLAIVVREALRDYVTAPRAPADAPDNRAREVVA